MPNPSSEQRTLELKPIRRLYSPPVSFAESLSEIPRLTFAKWQEWVRSAIAMDDAELTAEENALPDARMEDFRRQPDAGIPLEELREHVRRRRPINDSAGNHEARR